LKLQGLLPAGEATREELDNALLEGRYSELRMLFYVGKDLVRWIDQCLEFVERNNVKLPHSITYQSFAALLIQGAPFTVESKLRKWGVADYKSIFTRALGLQFLFADVPARNFLAEDFVRNYFRYAEQMFAIKQGECEFARINATEFQFELYSSGEYSRMLERSWGE